MSVSFGELSDQEWTRLEPLLPQVKPQRGGRWRDHRQVVEGMIFKDRTGCPWRDLPERFGPWQTVQHRFYRWAEDGTWERILTALQAEADAAGELDRTVSVASTIVRAHQHAAGAKGGSRKPSAAPEEA